MLNKYCLFFKTKKNLVKTKVECIGYIHIAKFVAEISSYFFWSLVQANYELLTFMIGMMPVRSIKKIEAWVPYSFLGLWVKS